MYTTLFWIIIVFLIADFAWTSFLDAKNRSFAKNEIPIELQGVYDEEKYNKQQEYFITNNKFSSITGIFSLAIILLMFFFFGFGFVDSIARAFCQPDSMWTNILTGLLFFAILYYANDILDIPFSAYQTFKIEEKFGFNKTTVPTFIGDIIKNWLLTAVFGALLIGLLMLIYFKTEEYFWILGWGVLVIFSIVTMMLYSSVIVPLFNKQTPLEEGELRNAIEDFCKKVDFQLDNLYVMDSSKRSTKANAYFSGLGSKKRIVLYDTLISTLTTEEIVAVLSHEIGHYKRKHTKKMLFFNIIYYGIIFFFLSITLKYKNDIAMTMGSEQGSFWLSLIVFAMLFSPISTIIGIGVNVLSRKNEYEADAFAKQNGKSDALISALKKLSSSSLTNLTPHPYYIFVHYSHPTLYQRIKALQS